MRRCTCGKYTRTKTCPRCLRDFNRDARQRLLIGVAVLLLGLWLLNVAGLLGKTQKAVHNARQEWGTVRR
jgi:uncharacterized paraquat-inducible protein A